MTSLSADLEASLGCYPDFPQPGILFRDLSPVLRNPALTKRLFAHLCEQAQSWGAQQIVGVESRGFLFGVPLALELGLPFAMVRKKGKLPGAVYSVDYALEYGTDSLQIQKDAAQAGVRSVIVDDVLATGGTAKAVMDLLGAGQSIVAGSLFVIELAALNGRQLLQKEAPHAPLHALLSI